MKTEMLAAAVTWPWDVLHWLHSKGKLFQWACNDSEPCKLHEQNITYWGTLSEEESVLNLDLPRPATTIPLFWHADGVRIFKQQKAWVYSYSSALKKGASLSSKLMLLLFREAYVWKPFTHDRIAEVIGWMQSVLQTGNFRRRTFVVRIGLLVQLRL